MSKQLSSDAIDAFQTILALRRHPATQTPHAEKKILGALSVPDYIAVVELLEEIATNERIPADIQSAWLRSKAGMILNHCDRLDETTIFRTLRYLAMTQCENPEAITDNSLRALAKEAAKFRAVNRGN